MQKLTKVLRNNQIFTVTLAKNDIIFKYVHEEKLIKIYNKMQNRDKCKQKPTEIILFEQPGY